MASTTNNGATVDNLNVLDTVTADNTGGAEIIELQDVANALFPTTNATPTLTIDSSFWTGNLKLTFAGSTASTYFTITGGTDGSGQHYFVVTQSDQYGNATGLSSLHITATTASQFTSTVTNAASLIGAGSNLSSTSLLTALDINSLVGKEVFQATTNGVIANIFSYASANDSFNGTGSQWDVINSFKEGTDKLDFRQLDKDQYALTTTGKTALSQGLSQLIWIGLKPANTTNFGPAGAYGVWYTTDGSGGSFVYADTDGDGKADLKIEVSGIPTLTSGDFLGVGVTVAISGTAQEGQTLTAVVGSVASGDTLTYQWITSNGNTVVGTGSTYLVKEGDEGNKITLTVTDHGSGTSAATAAALDALPTVR